MRFIESSGVWRWMVQTTGVGGAMLLMSLLAGSLYLKPGHESVIWSSAGIALAGILFFGHRVWPGIFIATLISGVNTLSTLNVFHSVTTTWMVSGLIALSVVGQAVLSSLLLKRFIGASQRADRMMNILIMIAIAGPIGCLLNPSLGTTVLVLADLMPSRLATESWFAWWVCDIFEIAVILPLYATWHTNMERAGLKSRLLVILPIILFSVVVAVVSLYSRNNEWRKERLMFERRSSDLAHVLWSRIESDVDVVFSIERFFNASDEISRLDFKRFVKRFLETKAGIQALEWVPRIPASQRGGYEKQASGEMYLDYRIRALNSERKMVVAGDKPEYFPVYYVEPYLGNERALGFDLSSSPARRKSMIKAAETGEAQATARIELIQEGGLQYGILLFVPVYQKSKPPETRLDRLQKLEGYALGVFKLKDLVQSVLKEAETSGMVIWLMDDSAPRGERLLYSNDPAMVEEILPVILDPWGPKQLALHWISGLSFAGRNWSIHTFPTERFISSYRPTQSWAILGFGMVMVSLLGSFLLIVIGRTRVTERSVKIRTAELSAANLDLEREVFERKQAEAKQQESDSRVRAIMNNVVDGIITINHVGVIELFNPAAELIFGYSKDEVIGRNVRMLMPEPFHSAHDGYLQNFVSTGIAKIIGIGREVAGLKKDGSVFPMDLAVGEMRVDDQLFFTGIVRDISERKEAEAQLKSSELRWQFALEGSQDGVWDWDMTTETAYYSPQWKRMLGYTTSEIDNSFDEWKTRLHDDDRSIALSLMDEHLAGKSSHFEVEHRLLCEDGTYKWILNRGKVVEWTEDERPSRFIGTNADITDQKRKEDILRRFHKAVDEAGAAIYITDINGQIEYVNPAFSEITGYEAEEALEKTPRILKSGQMNIEYYQRLWRTLLNGQIWHEDIINRKKNGTPFHAHQTVAPIIDENGIIEGFVAIQIDITELKQTEASLRENEALLEKAQQMARVGSWKWDLNTDELFVSNEIKRIYGIEDRSKPVSFAYLTRDRVHEADRAYVSEQAKKVYKNQNRPENMTFRIIRTSGEVRWVTTTTPEVHSYDATGNPEVMMGTVQDVTEIKLIEEELLQARAAAESASKAKSEFLANMSHEIRTPMNAVLGFSALLDSSTIDDKQRSYLNAINTSGKALLTLINDILDLSKIEAGKLDITLEPMNIRRIIEEMQQVFSARFAEKNIAFFMDLDPDLPPVVLLDETRVRQILLNLIGNAIKFTDAGHIRISGRLVKMLEDGEQIHFDILIEDTGIGIPRDQQELIFESFRQQDGQSNRKYGGTGLGLAISKRFVEMMNGRITLDSEVGRGSTFGIRFKNVAVANTVTLPDETRSPLGLNNTRFKPATILVADDTANNRRLLAEALKKTGLAIIEATDGVEAVDMAREESPAVIIMDIVMPKRNGIEACQILKEDPGTSGIPVIALTASVSTDSKEEMVKAGFDISLTKPIEMASLLESLARFLERADDELTEQETEAVPEMDNPDIQEGLLLLELLNLECLPLLNSMKGAIDMDEVEQFAERLAEIAQQHQVVVLLKYAEQLKNLVQQYDISGLEEATEDFPAIVSEITTIVKG